MPLIFRVNTGDSHARRLIPLATIFDRDGAQNGAGHSLPDSTQNLSRKGGIPARCAHPNCLISRVQSTFEPSGRTELSVPAGEA